MSSPGRRRALRRGLSVAIAVVAAILVVLLVLVAFGVLTLPTSHTPAPVTVLQVELVIQQGNTSSGVPWFGPSPIYFTNGFPLQVAPGGVFSVVWSNFLNFDKYNHTINRATPNLPFTLSSTIPALPHTVAFDSEGNNLAIYLQAPSTPGDSYSVTVIVSALTES